MLSARPRTPHVLSLPALALLSGFSVTGGLSCSAHRATGTFGSGGGATSGAIEATTGASSGGGAGGDEESTPILVDSSSSSGAGGQTACAQATAEARQSPLNIFIAVDQSGSMISDNKWEDAKSAFTQFFLEPNAATIGVALRFWPDPFDYSDPSPPIACNDAADSTCGPAVVAACEEPEVDVGPLSDPVHAQKLIAAFDAHAPDGSTPTSAALAGATKWAAKYIFNHGHAEQAIVLLVTDGEPTTCDTDPTKINEIAAKALSGAGVLTFAVGLAGSNQATMNAIAQAGGTGQAFMIANGMAAQDLLGALKQIQASAVACSFAMPLPPDPKDEIDLEKVDVNYTPSGGGAKSKFPQVASASACGAAGGFFYDNPGKPTTINLCPASCAKVQTDSGAKVDIFLGCIKKGPA